MGDIYANADCCNAASASKDVSKVASEQENPLEFFPCRVSEEDKRQVIASDSDQIPVWETKPRRMTAPLYRSAWAFKSLFCLHGLYTTDPI